MYLKILYEENFDERKYQSDEREDENTMQSDQAEGNKESEKDFFTKVLEESGRDGDKKYIFNTE